MDVTEPPNNAPQNIDESKMMADTGCIPKVSGSSSDTPFGAPRGQYTDENAEPHADQHQEDMVAGQRDAKTMHERFVLVMMI
jgi:hypothetical protein